MLHFLKEGKGNKVGLNIKTPRRWSWPWIALIWCWYDTYTYKTSHIYFRIRTGVAPYFIFRKGENDEIMSYCFDKKLKLVPLDGE